MAHEYARVLKALEAEFVVIGRGEQAVEKIKLELDINAVSGGLTQHILNAKQPPEMAIVCTPIEALSEVAYELIQFGVNRILLEKPGSLTVEELTKIKSMAEEKGALVHIGYNRRFYQSTIALEKYLMNEELVAANFEITEWSHRIVDEMCSDEVKQKWVLSNTSHVIDLVMYIAGSFKELSCFTSGSLSWHNASSRFVGAGVTDKGVLLSYCGYWDGPGRWSAEFVTTSHRYIFRPMEKLQKQKINSVAVEFDDDIDYSLDEKFKPGLFLQTKAFLDASYGKFVTLDEQIEAFGIFERMANYNTI